MSLKTSLLVISVILFLSLSPAQADSVNLNSFPDIFVGTIDVAYTVGGTDNFAANGFALTLFDGSTVHNIKPLFSLFSLIATIDTSGTMSDGTLNIGGTVSALGFTSGTLLTGVLTDFSFSTGGNGPLEFLFNVTGGDAAGLFGDNPGGIIISILTNDFPGSFSEAFTTYSTGSGGVANVGTVPEPSTLFLLLSGLGSLYVSRKHRGHDS